MYCSKLPNTAHLFPNQLHTKTISHCGVYYQNINWRFSMSREGNHSVFDQFMIQCYLFCSPLPPMCKKDTPPSTACHKRIANSLSKVRIRETSCRKAKERGVSYVVDEGVLYTKRKYAKVRWYCPMLALPTIMVWGTSIWGTYHIHVYALGIPHELPPHTNTCTHIDNPLNLQWSR